MEPSAPPPRHAILDPLSTLIATGLGTGYSPIAPGTFGSALGVALFWSAHRLPSWALAAAAVVIALVGVAAGDRLAKRMGLEDPGRVVVDEVAGMWVSLLFLPWSWKVAVIAFLAFRVMGIVKPWPARQLEDLHGGWGIMADDLMAGVYANLLVRVVLMVWPA
jgi:phosphatidylglycerophosphatase A